MERTLSIIKPDAVAHGHAGAILQRIEDSGLRIIATKRVRLDTAQAEAFYAVHQERPFYSSLVTFMTSGPVVACVLEGENAIERWRTLMGATDPEEADAGTIRKDFATNIERNCVHGSDAPETAATEVPFFFSELEITG